MHRLGKKVAIALFIAPKTIMPLAAHHYQADGSCSIGNCAKEGRGKVCGKIKIRGKSVSKLKFLPKFWKISLSSKLEKVLLSRWKDESQNNWNGILEYIWTSKCERRRRMSEWNKKSTAMVWWIERSLSKWTDRCKFWFNDCAQRNSRNLAYWFMPQVQFNSNLINCVM